MGIIGTAIGTGVALEVTRRRQDMRAHNLRIDRSAQVAPFVAWFDALTDSDAYGYSCATLGASRGSRYADRDALIAHHVARAF
jgi:hypothetical protein